MCLVTVCFTESVEAENCALISYYFTQILWPPTPFLVYTAY